MMSNEIINFKKLNRLKKENKIVTIIYSDDRVIYTDLDEVFERMIEIAPMLIYRAVVEYGLEKAKRIAGFVMECGNYWIDGIIDVDIANSLAKQWNVLDVLTEDLIKLFIRKHVVFEFET